MSQATTLEEHMERAQEASLSIARGDKHIEAAKAHLANAAECTGHEDWMEQMAGAQACAAVAQALYQRAQVLV